MKLETLTEQCRIEAMRDLPAVKKGSVPWRLTIMRPMFVDQTHPFIVAQHPEHPPIVLDTRYDHKSPEAATLIQHARMAIKNGWDAIEIHEPLYGFPCNSFEADYRIRKSRLTVRDMLQQALPWLETIKRWCNDAEASARRVIELETALVAARAEIEQLKAYSGDSEWDRR